MSCRVLGALRFITTTGYGGGSQSSGHTGGSHPSAYVCKSWPRVIKRDHWRKAPNARAVNRRPSGAGSRRRERQREKVSGAGSRRREGQREKATQDIFDGCYPGGAVCFVHAAVIACIVLKLVSTNVFKIMNCNRLRFILQT